MRYPAGRAGPRPRGRPKFAPAREWSHRLAAARSGTPCGRLSQRRILSYARRERGSPQRPCQRVGADITVTKLCHAFTDSSQLPMRQFWDQWRPVGVRERARDLQNTRMGNESFAHPACSVASVRHGDNLWRADLIPLLRTRHLSSANQLIRATGKIC
jgi:hypothetical protein